MSKAEDEINKDAPRGNRNRPKKAHTTKQKMPSSLAQQIVIQWQLAEWSKLAAYSRTEIEAESERSDLMLLVAAANCSVGNHSKAIMAAEQAILWGASRERVARALISAACHTLARLATSLDDPSAEHYYREAVRLVDPKIDVDLFARTRQIRETAALGLVEQAASLIHFDFTQLQELNRTDNRIKLMDSELELVRIEVNELVRRGLIYNGDRGLPNALPRELPARRSVAQLGQDLWVLERLKYKQGGFFVEFGATDGISMSNTYLLEIEYGWSGICAEPNPQFFQQLQSNRGCCVSNACIGARTGEQVDFIFADVYGGIASYAASDGHAEKRRAYEAEGRTASLTTVSLDDFLKENAAPRVIDYLSIDTEGSEYDILATFPFDNWHIKLITVEHNFTEKREAIFQLLTDRGYKRTEAQFDDWYQLEN